MYDKKRFMKHFIASYAISFYIIHILIIYLLKMIFKHTYNEILRKTNK